MSEEPLVGVKRSECLRHSFRPGDACCVGCGLHVANAYEIAADRIQTFVDACQQGGQDGGLWAGLAIERVPIELGKRLKTIREALK